MYNPAIDTSVFPLTVAYTYWSSTTYMADTSYAWLVNFEVGGSGYNKLYNYPVRCVSGP
ncbi:MAG: DUF1566 domain-containing protein [Leptonema sp. (in: Bacteria)]|nr:DUF1566 domain-containing protein [Leptonema sp. (in: bacteria)]